MPTCTRADYLPKKGRSYRLMHRLRLGSVGPHDHEFVEIAIVHEGEARHSCGGDYRELREGSVYLIPVGASHAVYTDGEICLSNLLLAPELVAQWRRRFGPLPGLDRATVVRLTGPQFAEAREMIERLAGLQEAMDEVGQFTAHGQLQQLMGLIFRTVQLQGGGATRAEEALRPAIALIEKRENETPSVAALAKAARVSERTLTRLFREAYGHAPLDYVLRRRLARAAELLLAGNTTVTDVAFACGFNDSNYFARQFRRVHGCAPTAFRERSGTVRDEA